MPATSGGRAADPLPEDAGALIAALAAEPRPAGGPAEERARARCAGFLALRGFAVGERAFDYSAFPGRWATSAGGIASGVLLGTAAVLGAGDRPSAALAVLVAGGAAVAAAGIALARGGVLGFPALRRRGVNLVAERGAMADERRRIWLVAHLDSKSQPVSIGARAAGIVATVAAWAAALALAAAHLARGPAAVHLGWWSWLGWIGLAAALPVALSVVGERSPGALDNATGVATVLRTVAALRDDVPLGVLLTSAEELGLAGSRAWAVDATPATALNVDGIDDAGGLTMMYSGRRPDSLLAAARTAAGGLGVAVRERRLLPGILVDAVALADAGWRTATLSRGTLATLARIHRPTDQAGRLHGGGVEEAARLAAGVVAALQRREEGY